MASNYAAKKEICRKFPYADEIHRYLDKEVSGFADIIPL